LEKIDEFPPDGWFLAKCREWQEAMYEQEQDKQEPEETKSNLLDSYLTYIERQLKARYFKNRADDYSTNNKLRRYQVEGDKTEDILAVETVSSTEYLDWMTKEYKKAKCLDLDVLESRIPRLRQLMFRFPAEKNHDTYSKHIGGKLNNILNRAEHFLESESSNKILRQRDFGTLLANFRAKYRNILNSLRSAVAQFLAGQVQSKSSKMYSDHRVGISQQIKIFLEGQMESLHWSTYLKIMHRSGILGPNNSVSRHLQCIGCNRNKDIARTIRPITRNWKTKMQTSMEELAMALITQVCQGADYLMIALIHSSNVQDRNKRIAMTEWKTRIDQFCATADHLREDLKDCIRDAFNYATDERDLNSMMVKLLKPTYSSAAKVRGGKGVFDRTHRELRDNLIQGSLVDNFVDELLRNFGEVVHMRFDKLIADMNEELYAFEDILKYMQRKDVVPNPKTQEVRTALQKLLPELRKKHQDLVERFPPLPMVKPDPKTLKIDSQEADGSRPDEAQHAKSQFLGDSEDVEMSSPPGSDEEPEGTSD
jgi:hypothetical protein